MVTMVVLNVGYRSNENFILMRILFVRVFRTSSTIRISADTAETRTMQMRVTLRKNFIWTLCIFIKVQP